LSHDPQVYALIERRQRPAPERTRLLPAIHRGAMVVTLVAAVGMLVAHAVLRSGVLGPSSRWADVVVAGLVALAVAIAQYLVWPLAMLCDYEGRAQRRNATWLVLPVAVVSSYYFMGIGRATESTLPGTLAFALAAAVICGAAMAWAVSLARAEHDIALQGRIGTTHAARAVGIGVIGLVGLIIALSAVGRFEYTGRSADVRQTGALIKLAGRQRMLSIALGRSAARIGAEPQMQPELVQGLNAALSRFQSEGKSLETAAAEWKLHRSVDVDDNSLELMESAGAMRRKIFGYTHEVLNDLRKRADPGASSERLQSAIDDGLAAFELVDDSLQAASRYGRRELELTTSLGLGLLVLVALGGGIGVSRAVALVVRRQGVATAAHAAAAYRLAAVARSTTNLVITTDMAGCITWANEAFENVTGYKLAEALGRRPGALLQCEQTDKKAIAQMRDAIARSESTTVEILNRGKTGNRYWLRLAIEPLYDAVGIQSGFMAIETDITEAVMLREQRRGIFEAMAAGVVVQDSEGIIVDCNSAACRMLGMEPQLLRGRGAVDSRWRVTREDGSEISGEEHFAMYTLRTGEAVSDRVMGVDIPDSPRVWLSVSTRLIADAQTGRRTVIWSLTDISLRKRAETDLSVERKLVEEGLHREARTDKLTGLANRAGLLEFLETVVAAARIDSNAGFGLLFLDFDRFKLVNDTLGHAAGDALLCLITERLRNTRDNDSRTSFVARMGGDEFVILLPWTSDLAVIDTVAQRLLGSLAAPYVVCGTELRSSASIGVVSSSQGDLDASTILRNADTAMYEAKRRGRGLAVVYDASMHARLQREVMIERNLRHAIATGEISVRYQPIVDLETGDLASVEALARWHSAELGEVSPNEFIPIAEEYGVIAELGEWILHKACEQFADWVANYPKARATISVNLSRVQMGKPEHLLRTIEKTLAATGLAPNRLQLEVTERDVMGDPAAVLVLMRRLRAIGVRLAMDDFGTGTSSLACLRDYPFDVIKIDRAFVGDLDSSSQVLALVHATMMLIENLGMVSVAEGVETHVQAAILQSVGCRLGQGWVFGRPVAISDIQGTP